MLTALGPVALKFVVDGFTGQASGPTVPVFLLIGLYILSQWLARSAAEIRGLIFARVERRMFRTLSERLFSHLMQLPLRYHLNRRTGAITQTLENGLQGYQMILHHLVFTLLPVTVQLSTIILVFMKLTHPIFLMLFCGALACYAVAFVYAAAATSKAAMTASTAHIDAYGVMTDGILNYETVKYFAAEAAVQEKVSSALSRTENAWVGFYRRYAYNGLAVGAIYAVFLGATIVYAAYEVQHARMSVGDFVLINTYMLQVVQPVEILGYGMQQLSQGLAMLHKMLDLLRERPESQRSYDGAIDGKAAELQFDQVDLSYEPGRPVLKDVSFLVPAGKTLGIVGASGSGKSTIVRLLVRLFEPDNGRILLDGGLITELSLPAVRRSIAVVPQETVLFNDTIGFNIAFGKPNSSIAEIEQAAKLAHLHDFIMSLPNQYETPVGERGVKLSGGERQRVSIARAVIKQPRIYVFDEATSSLDSQTEREILFSLLEIARSSTAIVIAHRLSTVVHADEIIVLEAGVIVERGTHMSLLKQGGCYAALWKAQQLGAVGHRAVVSLLG
jgi:ABC-type transport system involved in Fe-S cluster assembly, permease and ATPase components